MTTARFAQRFAQEIRRRLPEMLADMPEGTPQVGVAPNNIELHPVLKFTAENCHPV